MLFAFAAVSGLLASAVRAVWLVVPARVPKTVEMSLWLSALVQADELLEVAELVPLPHRFVAFCVVIIQHQDESCLLYTSPSPRDLSTSRMPSSA